LAMVGSIPHVDCYALTCSEEADALVYQAVAHFAKERQAGRTPNSVVFFLGRENFPKAFAEKAQYKLGQSQIVKETSASSGKSVCLVAAGSLIPQAMEAAEALEKKGIGAVVVNPAILNRFDTKFWADVLKKTEGRMVTVEDHQILHGYGASLAHHLILAGISLRLRSLGVRGRFGQSAYNAIDLYRKHRLDAASIVEEATSLI
ncbi:MAG TPA: transketolase C-terminal domain-containing protein, partial [Pseudobdellovibrionaceae bacterium]|nr:transketolase C-terminal domain-containing protein [Pseudobdellovibrionaceae bacterium]